METATTMEMEMEATTIQEVRKIPMKPFVNHDSSRKCQQKLRRAEPVF